MKPEMKRIYNNEMETVWNSLSVPDNLLELSEIVQEEWKDKFIRTLPTHKEFMLHIENSLVQVCPIKKEGFRYSNERPEDTVRYREGNAIGFIYLVYKLVDIGRTTQQSKLMDVTTIIHKICGTKWSYLETRMDGMCWYTQEEIEHVLGKLLFEEIQKGTVDYYSYPRIEWWNQKYKQQ